MCNITSYQENAVGNQNEVVFHPCQNGYHQRVREYQMLVRMGTGRNCCPVIGTVSRCGHCGKHFLISVTKLQI